MSRARDLRWTGSISGALASGSWRNSERATLLIRALVDERLEDFYERSLLLDRQPRQRERSCCHPSQELRPQPRAGGRELKDFHTAVLWRRLTPDETSGFQAIDQPGDV